MVLEIRKLVTLKSAWKGWDPGSRWNKRGGVRLGASCSKDELVVAAGWGGSI